MAPRAVSYARPREKPTERKEPAMSYTAHSFSALVNALRAAGVTRPEQMARQPFRNAQGYWSAVTRS